MTNLYLLNEIYTSGFFYNSLNIISIFSILSGISVIVAKNPVISVLFLIGLFFSIASYLMMLGLNFIGLSYLLVYVGAVSILFLFILMLINVRMSELLTDNNNSLILAFLVGIFLFIPIFNHGSTINSINFTSLPNVNVGKDINESLYTSMATSTNFLKNEGQIIWGESDNSSLYETLLVTSRTWDGTLSEYSHITTIGSVLYTNYPLWLILTSIILLLAMVGAIVITIKK